jgi:hypothetical protein
MGMDLELKGKVQRSLPTPDVDNTEADARWSRFGGLYMVPHIRTQHILADEGSYYVANNNSQTAITGQTDQLFNALKPTVSIFNKDKAGGTGKRLFLDYLYLVAGGTAFTNATSNTGTFLAIVIDDTDRGIGSTGSPLTTFNPNQDSGVTSQALVRCGALTANAASQNARLIVPQRLLRLPVSATALTLANVDEFYLNFGGVEVPAASPVQASATLEATKVSRTIALPPVIVGPQQSCLIYVFSVAGGAVTAGNFLPELGWAEL